MRVTGRQWAVAIPVAVLIHAGVFSLWLYRSPSPIAGAQSAGSGGIELALGVAAATPAEMANAAEVAQAAADAPEQAVEEQPPEVTRNTDDTEALTQADPAQTPAREQPTEISESQAVPITADSVPDSSMVLEPRQDMTQHTPPVSVARESDITEAAPTRSAASGAAVSSPAQAPIQDLTQDAPPVLTASTVAPVPDDPPRPMEEVARVVDVEAVTARELRPDPRPAPTQVQEQHVASQAAAPPATETTATEQTKSAALPSTASSQSAPSGTAPGGSIEGAEADYWVLLQTWLERHRRYPMAARRRRLEGTAMLMFEMDRDGNVLRYRIQQSSGHDLLDREVEGMIQRAQPLPKIPRELGKTTLRLNVPISFQLR